LRGTEPLKEKKECLFVAGTEAPAAKKGAPNGSGCRSRGGTERKGLTGVVGTWTKG
jgi:hypothetical protein